jgi:hypothetical protein
VAGNISNITCGTKKLNDISHKIIEYKTAYEMLGIKDIPSYRLTCKEHKELVELCKQFLIKTSIVDGEFKTEPVQPISMISQYYGVNIEVVMIVDPYL